MHIGMFVELYRPYTSGVVVAVEDLCRELQRQGHEVVIFAPYMPRYKDSNEFQVIRLPGYYIAWPFLTRRVIDQVKKLKLDIIHIHGPYHTGFLGVHIAKRLDIPVVMTSHTQIFMYLRIWLKVFGVDLSLVPRLIAGWATRYVSKGCKLIITPGKCVKDVLVESGVKAPIYTLPNGITILDSLPDKALVRQELGLPGDNTLLVYVGRIAQEKNLGMLLEAFEWSCGRNTRTKLILVGGGRELERIKRYVDKNGLQDRIIFVGCVPHNKVWSYLAAADMFVFPSITETNGLVVSEAMAAGLPVIVTDEGGACELVTHEKTGLITKNHPRRFADEIGYLLEHPGTGVQLGQNAQKKICKIVSIGHFCDSIVKYYKQAIASP